MSAGGAAHWDAIYRARDETRLTWFEAMPAVSRDLICRHAAPDAAILDVGGGASRLPDALLAAGVSELTVLDLSDAALRVSRARLGARADAVTWIAADVTRWTPPRRYGLWHDRAVFHFLIDPSDRAAYVRTMAEALEPGGVAIIAGFAPDGPETCSGLPVMRYSPMTLMAEIDRIAPGSFTLSEGQRHVHDTPLGRQQAFHISVFRRV